MKAFSAGIKNRLLDNRLQLNVSAFYYDYRDRVHQAMQFASFYFSPPGAPPGPQPNFTYCPFGSPDFFAGYCMARPDEGGRVPGDLTMKGVDVQTQWIITGDDKLDVSISYLDSWIDEMIADYEFKDQPYSSEYDFSDRKPTFSPEWTISLNYSHNFNLPNGATITARYDTRYQSEYEIDWWETRMGVDQTGYKTQEAHHIDNVTVVYTHPDGKWTLSGYVKNIWDYAEKRFMTAMGAINMNIGPPRTYGAILSVRF
jgi:iron complex outermembrane receptor protein